MGTRCPPIVGPERRATGRETDRGTRRRVGAVRTGRLAAAVDAAVAAGGSTRPRARSLGTARTGNRATGTTTSGTATAILCGSTIDFMVAVNRLP